jgi:hypothetical protein
MSLLSPGETAETDTSWSRFFDYQHGCWSASSSPLADHAQRPSAEVNRNAQSPNRGTAALNVGGSAAVPSAYSSLKV